MKMKTTKKQTMAGFHDKPVIGNLNDEGVRAVIYQILFAGVIVFTVWYLASNTVANLERQNIQTGFGFLNLEAAFGISESPVDYTPADSYARAMYVGFLNTVKVSVLGIIFTTALGIFVGVARLSQNWLLQKISTAYVDLFRNIPILLQLMFWYTLMINLFPHPRSALNPLGDIYLTNRGVFLPVPAEHPVYQWMVVVALIGVGAGFLLRKWAVRRQAISGETFPVLPATLGLIGGAVLLTYLLGGMPSEMNFPVKKGFGLSGGWSISPEFSAILIGLTVYTSTYVAEIVRSGILAVPKGQWEAADSLGLSRSHVLRHIILPQSMRVAIPPLTNQYLNLTKNSSLAVAIGYPDIVSVANTTMNQTGQAIEAILIFMTVYLGLSILTSLFMNWFNGKMKLVER